MSSRGSAGADAVRIGNLAGRLVVIAGDRAIDVERASDGRFGADAQAVYAVWEEFRRWAGGLAGGGDAFEIARLQAPVPRPAQVFAIGLNYRDHADETGFERPMASPLVFTKFPSAVTGPFDDVSLPPGGSIDWEVELVAVIGRPAYRVRAEDAWDHIAGLTVGQDLSERILQMAAAPPQFSLGKSYPGFAPLGPVLVTPDEFVDPDDLGLRCSIDGETVQEGRTSQMIFSVGQLVEVLSAVLTLGPGDLIFTGTPAGVGMGRTPQRFLRPGETLESWIEGIGSIANRMVPAPA